MARRWSFLMPPMQSRSLRLLDDVYRGRLTEGGRVMVWGLFTCGLMISGGLMVPLLVCFGFCAAALILGVVLGAPFRPNVRMQRHITAFPSAGDLFTYRVSVENTGRRTIRNLFVEERRLPAELRPVGEPPVIDVLQPGERTTVTLSLRCGWRGAYVLDALQAGTAFPTGVFKWSRRSPTQDRVLVYPRFTPLPGFEVPLARNYQPGGIAVASQVGESTEFFGTRDWRNGDRIRDVHWPSFARTGKLIIKEFQEEYFIRLALVIDVEAANARQEFLLERGLSVAAGIADVLARQEYIIDLFAAGPQVFHFQAGRALAHFDNILEILACLDSGDRLDVAVLERALSSEARSLSAVIFVMMDWEEQRAALVQRLKDMGVAVRVISLRADRPPQGLAPDEVVRL